MQRMTLWDVTGPAAEGGVPPPETIAICARKLANVAQRLQVLGWGGVPPVNLSALPDPQTLPDRQRTARTQYIVRAQEMFGNELLPLANPITRMKELLADTEASWRLYNFGVQVFLGVGDYQLAAGAGHRLVMLRVLPAVIDVLKEGNLESGEADALAMDLTELQALMSQDLTALRAVRSQTTDQAAQIAAEVADLQAEEHLVGVMLRLTTKSDVTTEDLARAAETYQTMLAKAEQEGLSDPTAAPATQDPSADRRISSRSS